eukprot:gene39104-48295_t
MCPKPYHLTPYAVNRSSSAAKKESPLVSLKNPPLALSTANVLNLSNPSAIKSIKSIAVLPKTLRDPFSRCVSSPGMTDRNDLPKRRSILVRSIDDSRILENTSGTPTSSPRPQAQAQVRRAHISSAVPEDSATPTPPTPMTARARKAQDLRTRSIKALIEGRDKNRLKERVATPCSAMSRAVNCHESDSEQRDSEDSQQYSDDYHSESDGEDDQHQDWGEVVHPETESTQQGVHNAHIPGLKIMGMRSIADSNEYLRPDTRKQLTSRNSLTSVQLQPLVGTRSASPAVLSADAYSSDKYKPRFGEKPPIGNNPTNNNNTRSPEHAIQVTPGRFSPLMTHFSSSGSSAALTPIKTSPSHGYHDNDSLIKLTSPLNSGRSGVASTSPPNSLSSQGGVDHRLSPAQKALNRDSPSYTFTDNNLKNSPSDSRQHNAVIGVVLTRRPSQQPLPQISTTNTSTTSGSCSSSSSSSRTPSAE